MTTIDTPDGIAAFRALCTAQALEMWVKHKMLTTRGATPSYLMRLATQITGKTFKPRNYAGAAVALREMLKAQRAA